MRARAITVTVAGVALSAAALVGTRISQRAARERWAAELTGGDSHRGRAAMAALGCVACHDVPGFSGTRPVVGPPLAGFASRTFVAGAAENSPAKVVQFIRDPRSVAPKSAMPKLPMSEAQAQDLAAFLYTLQ